MPRSIRPRTPRNLRPIVVLRHVCHLNSAAAFVPQKYSPRPNQSQRPPNGGGKPPPRRDDDVIDLQDHEKLYSSFDTWKLLKSWFMLQAAAKKPVSDLGSWVMRSGAMESPIARRVVLGFTESTFFDHFCGGKDLPETATTVRKLWEAGLNAMLDYGLEHSNDNQSCDRNMSEFVRSIEWTDSLNSPCASFTVLKITALCPTSLLRRVSDLLRWEYSRGSSINLPWKLRTLPIFTDDSPFYHTLERPAPLTPQEESDLELAYKRLEIICNKSVEANVPILIDAEDTSIQPAIDYLAYSAAVKYKLKNDEPLIFNTIQAYLRDATERLVSAKAAADRMGTSIGFKLVRGAYMSSEVELARTLGFKSPINNGIEQTHTRYNTCAEFMLHEIARGKGSVVFATHNVGSCQLVAVKASELGIERGNPNIQFAQLYGMSEALSFGLKHAGFKVSKYLPFGPVEQIMPYLLRRAEENRGLLSSSSLDRLLMRKELVRRLKSRISGRHHRRDDGGEGWNDESGAISTTYA